MDAPSWIYLVYKKEQVTAKQEKEIEQQIRLMRLINISSDQHKKKQKEAFDQNYLKM